MMSDFYCRLSTSFVVSAGVDLTIKMWSLPSLDSATDLTSPLPLQTTVMQRAHDKEIQSLAVSPNDKLIATGSRDKKAKVWEMNGFF
jgi:U3 small nucleolar RNA-associated protein 13